MKIIPNLITLAALCFGCLSLMAVMDGVLSQAALFIFIALMLDLLDGFAARVLKAGSELGKQLDSLSDMVSFGVAPALLMYSYSDSVIEVGAFENDPILSLVPYLSFAIAICAALRLAKFNITDQAAAFSGIPSPLAAIMFAAIPIVEEAWRQHKLPVLSQTLIDAISNLSPSILLILLGLAIISISLLMVINFPVLNLKFKSFKWQTNELRYLFLAGLAICFIVFGWLALFIGSIFYIALSPAIWNRKSK